MRMFLALFIFYKEIEIPEHYERSKHALGKGIHYKHLPKNKQREFRIRY